MPFPEHRPFFSGGKGIPAGKPVMNLNKEILRLALPSILANITVPLVGMVDMAVAGHLPGGSSAAFIGGITIGTMLFDLLYWNFGFLRVGTGGLTAQAYGRGEETGSILRRALRIALLSGVAMIALQWVIVQLAFLLVDCSPEVRQLASRYFYIRIWAAPATLSLFAFKGWFIGEQDTVRPMTADLLVNGVNIAASIGLSLVIGFPGIALGTFLAQWSGFSYCLIAARRRYGYSIALKSMICPSVPVIADTGTKTEATETKDFGSGSFFQLNRDLILRSLGMIAVYIGFTIISARYGDLMLAVSAILMKLLMFFSYFSDGFAYAGEALTGRFIGEGSREGVRATIRGTFLWGIAVAALFMLLYGLGGVPVLRLMTDDSTVVDAGRAFLPWLLLMPLIGCPAFIWDGIFIGATASRDLRNSTLLCAVGFFAVWFAGVGLMKTPEAAIHLLMAAYFVHLAIRAGYLTLRWPSYQY
jgi:MATE family multidrug resistance protein